MDYSINKEKFTFYLLLGMVLLSLISFEKTIYFTIYGVFLKVIMLLGVTFVIANLVMKSKPFEVQIFQTIQRNRILILLIYSLLFASFFSSLNNGLISFDGIFRLVSTIASIIIFFLIIPNSTQSIVPKVNNFIIYIISTLSVIGIITKINGYFLIYGTFYGRVNSIYFDPNYFGTIAGTAVILCVNKSGPFFKVLLMINFIALFFSNSRTAFLALSITMIITFFYKRKVKIITILLSLFLLLLAAIGMYFLYEMDFFRIEQGLNSRDGLWKIAISLITQQPLWGYGLESIPYLLTINGVDNGGSTHNAYLDNMLSYGIPCTVLYILIILNAFYRGLKNSVDRTFIQIALFLFICSSAITINIGGLGATSFLFTFYLGLCNANTFQNNN